MTGLARPRLIVLLILAALAGQTISPARAADQATPSPPALSVQEPQEASPQAPDVAVGQPTTQGPSQDELDRADIEPAQWLTYNKRYLGYRFSRLAQINVGNVHDLKVICSFKLGEKGSFQNEPIVYEGVLYTTSPLAAIAIDAATCEKRWEYHYSPGYLFQPNNKGAAIAGGRVIRGMPDRHLIALDAKTGALLWTRQIMDSTKGEFATAAPLVWNDLVFIGKAGADFGIRGEMMAFRASDGEKV